jgi:hypothetical protein
MRMQIPLSMLAAVVLIAVGCRSSRESATFRSDAAGGPQPWTHLRFADRPENFHFAILADRAGGHRPDVFEAAVEQLNRLQPEFAICVGDLIEGNTTERPVLESMWSEMNAVTSRLTMPFFRVPGNHDVTTPVMRQYYDQTFGRTYYHFVYRNVLFLCLNSQDGYTPAGTYQTVLSPEQRAYARRVLAENRDVRWTFVFLHKPLWLSEGGGNDGPRTPESTPETTGYAELLGQLGSRNYTVVAGHNHSYAKYERQGRSCYILATTGGGSAMRGPFFGETDAITWVTLTDRGPVMANLRIDGILPDDYRTEEKVRQFQALVDPLRAVGFRLERGATRLPEQLSHTFTNPYPREVRFTADWSLPAGSPWQVEPRRTAFTVPAGESRPVVWTLGGRGTPGDLTSLEPLPAVTITAAFDDGLTLFSSRAPAPLAVDAWPHGETRAAMRKAVSLGKLTPSPTTAPCEGQIAIAQSNVLQEATVTTLSWQGVEETGWRVTPATATLELAPGARGSVSFTAQYSGPAPIWKRPFLRLETRAGAAQALVTRTPLPANLDACIAARPQTLAVTAAARAPAVDGVREPEAWDRASRLPAFWRCETGEAATNLTAAWATYDATRFYLAVRCDEPAMERLQARAATRDGSDLWRDDGVEIFLAPGEDRAQYFHFCVTASNTVSDARLLDKGWNCAGLQSAVVRDAAGYTVEFSVPWASLGLAGAPKPGTAIGFNLVRNRYADAADCYQWCPTLGSSHKPKLFGRLVLE